MEGMHNYYRAFDGRYYSEGYIDSLIICVYGVQKAEEDWRIDMDKYSPDSAKRRSYDAGFNRAIEDCRNRKISYHLLW